MTHVQVEPDAEAASQAEANRILSDAGWSPIPKPCWAGGFTMARQVGGVDPWGTQFVKGLDIVKPDDPRYGPDTPDEHHEAAAWLVEHAKALHRVATPAVDLTTEATLEPPTAETDEITVTSNETVEHVTEIHSAEAAAIAEVEALFEGGEPEATDEAVLDADFEAFGEPEALEAEAGAEPLALEDLGAEIAATEDEAAGVHEGQDRFIFSDDLNTIRWAKGGRLLEIAGEREAALQAGWTLDEFRSLQNLVQRMERGEAPNDQPSRDRFAEISAKSRQIGDVTSYMKQRSDELKGLDRAGVEAFDPEAGWP